MCITHISMKIVVLYTTTWLSISFQLYSNLSKIYETNFPDQNLCINGFDQRSVFVFGNFFGFSSTAVSSTIKMYFKSLYSVS